MMSLQFGTSDKSSQCHRYPAYLCARAYDVPHNLVGYRAAGDQVCAE